MGGCTQTVPQAAGWGQLLTQASLPSQCDTRSVHLGTTSHPQGHLCSPNRLSQQRPRSAGTWPHARLPPQELWLGAGTAQAGLYPESVRLNHYPQPGKKSSERKTWGSVPAPPQISCAASGSSLSSRSVFLPVKTGRYRLLTSRSVPSTGTLNLDLPNTQGSTNPCCDPPSEPQLRHEWGALPRCPWSEQPVRVGKKALFFL